MKKIFFLFVLGLTMQLFAQLPPIIDRELFFGDPEIAGAQISPDGNYITFLKPFNNVRNIWIKERNQKFEEARPLTNDTKRPITSYFWSQDSKYVLFVQDQGGNENYRVYAVDPTAKGDPVPEARDLTPLDNVRAMIYDVPRKTPNEIFIGLNDRNPQLHDVYKLNLTTGEKTLIRKNDDNVAGWVFDQDGNLRLGLRQTADGGTEILKVDGDKLVSIYSVNNEEQASPYRFTPDGKSFYVISNKGEKADKIELLLFNVENNKVSFVERDPENEVDFGGAVFSDNTDELLATFYRGDHVRVYFKNKDFEKAYNDLKKAVPEGEIGITSMTSDENIWVVNVSRDVDPGSTYLFDRKTGKAELLYKSRPNLPTEYLASMKPIKYKAKDGLMIPAYLILPKGIPEKNLPAVIFPHGGPWARDYWGYNPFAQFMANRGYAVLLPNFRGSTGYGKKFLNAGNKQWGRGTMQQDLTDGVNYLIKEGIADPKKVAIAGGSYGGYATLAGLAFTPDLYAAGFDIVGPSNIITLLNSIPPYWAPMKKMFDVRVGDMNDPKEKQMLEEQSPLNYAKEIKAPLYVVQGANDPRVKKAEADQIVVALRDLGRDVEYMVAPDEGHGFAGKENRLAMIVAMENFFAKYLGGRVQQDVKPEIEQRLKDITVDIKTVTMPKRENADDAVSVLKSFDGSKISPSSSKYVMKIDARGQKFEMPVQRDVTKSTLDGKNVFMLVDAVSGMMGGNDTLFVDAANLLPIKRNIKQGMATIHLTFKPDLVEGQIEAGPQKMPVNVKLDVPVITEGSGFEVALRTLPIAEGYKASFNQLDIMKAKAELMNINVLGKEKVTLPAGEFDTYKIEVKPAEGGEGGNLMWIDAVSKTLVKSEAKLGAAMGGGSVTIELTK
jgi:dipeptidyl aminopeptidase/acylaminoacyl peptidase